MGSLFRACCDAFAATCAYDATGGCGAPGAAGAEGAEGTLPPELLMEVTEHPRVSKEAKALVLIAL